MKGTLLHNNCLSKPSIPIMPRASTRFLICHPDWIYVNTRESFSLLHTHQDHNTLIVSLGLGYFPNHMSSLALSLFFAHAFSSTKSLLNSLSLHTLVFLFHSSPKKVIDLFSSSFLSDGTRGSILVIEMGI